jgi:hypothetical protein
MAQTSDKVSSIAARYATMTADRLLSLTATDEMRRQTAEEIKTLAASALRQDETRGLRKLLRKVGL